MSEDDPTLLDTPAGKVHASDLKGWVKMLPFIVAAVSALGTSSIFAGFDIGGGRANAELVELFKTELAAEKQTTAECQEARHACWQKYGALRDECSP